MTPVLDQISGLFTPSLAPAGGGVVYLTFDDGPSDASEIVSRLLAERESTATFFLLGLEAMKDRRRSSRLSEAGHTIAYHGHAHLDAWRNSPSRMLSDLSMGLEKLRSERHNLKWFRPAFGRLAPWTWQWAQAEGLRTVLWNINSQDYRADRSPEEIVAQVVSRAQSGDVVLLHEEGSAWTSIEKELPPLLDSLLEKGFTLRGLPE